MKKSLHLVLFLFLLVQACMVKDAQEPKKQVVHVFTDVYTKQDKAIFKKFKKEEKIKVYIHLISGDTINQFLTSNKYNADADLLLLKDYGIMQKISLEKKLLPIKSEKLEENIDPLYRSKYNKWFALSKTPLVVVYNEKVLKKDTLKTYADLNDEKWKGKIAFQEMNHPTQMSFRRNMRLILGDKTDAFLNKFYIQRLFPFVANDEKALLKVKNFEQQLALVQLSSLVSYQNEKAKKNESSRFVLKPIFPNQKKKGCYLKVTSAGVYRYAKNPLQAQRLLEFLASKKAQYAFAEGRFESPIVKGVKSHYLLENYGKFRGRFYKGKKN